MPLRPDPPVPPPAVSFFRQPPVLLLLAGFVLVIAIAVAVAAFTFAVRDNTREVDARFRAIVEVSDILSALQDAETAQRGFLLTGEEAYLEPFFEDPNGLGARLDALEDSLDDPYVAGDVRRLHAVVDDKIAEMTSTIGISRLGTRAPMHRATPGSPDLVDRCRGLWNHAENRPE